MNGLQTEFDFFLPKGFVDEQGQLHRAGTMRLATARDELDPLRDPRVRDADDPFLTILVLSRVVSRLGSLSDITPKEIENLFAADLAYLQDVYGAINFGSPAEIAAVVDDASTRTAESKPKPKPVKAAKAVEPVADDDDLDDDAESSDEPEEQAPVTRRRHVEEVGKRQG